MKNPKNTPSWPQALAAKAAWNAVRISRTATIVQKNVALKAYKAKVRLCLREAGRGGLR